MKAEGRMTIRTEEVPVTLADGTVVTLSRPYYGIADLAYGSLHPDVMLSPRVAPQMIGLGLLEAVYDSDIARLADPEDADGDGISGRVNRVWEAARQDVVPGRFGWQTTRPTVCHHTPPTITVTTVHLPTGMPTTPGLRH